MKLNVAVIGCGNISNFHFSGLEKAEATVKWVCDLNEDAARPWADKFNARYTADYRTAIADPDVTVVDVTTISAVHKKICLDAIAAGKAVICEKTLAENAADARDIAAAAQAGGTIFYTSYMKRFIPAVAKAKELLPSLGEIMSTHIRTYQHWGPLWSGMPASGFFHTPPDGMSTVRKNYGGGILVCGGSHLLDLVTFFLGRPHRLYATMKSPAGADYDIQAAALLETENGIVHYEALAHPMKGVGFLRDGWDERIEINGVNGRLDIYSAQWDNPHNKPSLLVHTNNESRTATEYRLEPVSPFDEAIRFYCENIANDTQGTQSILTGYEVDELIEHIKKSAESKSAIEVKWKL